MTSVAQLTELVEAHMRRDHERFRAVTLAIAANLAARSERGADQLRKLVEKQVQSLTPLPSANGLLSVRVELALLDDMVLSPTVRERLARVVLEHGQRDVLLVHSLRPTRKLLFTGPPGVGKTMAAGALATAVGLPLLRVELHEVIQSHLGETAGKLSKVFEHVRQMPAVYLFDEFDALGADRGQSDGSSAGAEMRRVVNSLLQFIEDDRSESLIIAATNHAQMLDRAIFRRFDDVIAFAIPSEEELRELVRRSLADVDVEELDLSAIYETSSTSKLGHADVCAALDRVHKDHVLVGTLIDTRCIVDGLARRSHLVETGVFA